MPGTQDILTWHEAIASLEPGFVLTTFEWDDEWPDFTLIAYQRWQVYVFLAKLSGGRFLKAYIRPLPYDDNPTHVIETTVYKVNHFSVRDSIAELAHETCRVLGYE